MRSLFEILGLSRDSGSDVIQSPLQNTVLPDQQRDKLEKDILILDDEFGLKEKRLHKEAEKQVQYAAEDSLKQLHVIQMGLCPRCGEHLNESLFATVCQACGWNTYEVPARGPVRVHMNGNQAPIEGDRCYVTATGEVFLIKNDVVIAKINKNAVGWIEYVWSAEEIAQRYRQVIDRLKIKCSWCEKEADPNKEGFALVQTAFGSCQERYIFCSQECYEAFRKMYPSRVHRNCYERKCSECNLCTKRYDDESEGIRMIAKDFIKVKNLEISRRTRA
ncbi:MAG: hypothetical protein WC299_03565 [Kiritimatiellia bacterium]